MNTVQDYLERVRMFRNKVAVLHKEAESLAKDGFNIQGNYSSVDFDGDFHASHSNLGDALSTTCELDLVAAALYHWMNGGYQSKED